LTYAQRTQGAYSDDAGRLDDRMPVTEIRASSQLFVSPDPLCRRLVSLAEVVDSDHVLEPSAGTGAILRAVREGAPRAQCDAVELNADLVCHLRDHFGRQRLAG
jgi:16S rRNA A1518/A1519 N6-dimethyltransferase RsmA/KsgA/DIM1 with predicted DNA glycosylase/AP lyase activity